MAIARFLYKKRQLLFVLLCVTSFWFMYIFLSLPQQTKTEDPTSFSDSSSKTQTILRTKEETIKDRTVNNVIDAPKVVQKPVEIQSKADEKKNEKDDQKDKETSKKKGDNPTVKIDKVSTGGTTSKVKTNSSVQNKTVTKAKAKEKGNFDIVFEKIKNKTLEVGETVKNKTLQKLSQLGMFQPKQYKKLLFEQGLWPLNLSLEDVGGIMQDTAYLQKEEKISINYPKLLSTKMNQTVGNETITLRNLTMINSVGFCDCKDYECFCCARVAMKKMHVNNTACANFTFMTKSQEFDYRFSLDKKVLDKKIISAEQPPSVCLGSISKVGAVCTRFLNVTSKVSVDEDHKLHVVGCLEFSLMLFNKTVSAFPVDCFQLPSHEHKAKEAKAVHDFGNWMP